MSYFTIIPIFIQNVNLTLVVIVKICCGSAVVYNSVLYLTVTIQPMSEVNRKSQKTRDIPARNYAECRISVHHLLQFSHRLDCNYLTNEKAALILTIQSPAIIIFLLQM